MLKLHGFPQDRCTKICSDYSNCICFNNHYMKCITEIIASRLYNFGSIASLMLYEGKCKQYEGLLNNAIKDLHIVADWIEALQRFGKNGNGGKKEVHIIPEDRRICPRYNTEGKKIIAKINNHEYGVLNIGLNGCFIETEIPYPPATVFPLKLLIKGQEIRIITKVRHSTKQGIGVEFTEIDKASELKFYSVVGNLFLQTSADSLQEGTMAC